MQWFIGRPEIKPSEKAYAQQFCCLGVQIHGALFFHGHRYNGTPTK